MDFKCDLYCYGDVAGGITTHVAAKRVVGDVPPTPNILEVSPEEYVEAYRKQMDFLETAKREPIGLPEDGESFNDPDSKAFLERLLYLKGLGYIFPDGVIDEVKEDIKNEAGGERDSSQRAQPIAEQ